LPGNPHKKTAGKTCGGVGGFLRLAQSQTTIRRVGKIIPTGKTKGS
jgi:hypothetical protein